MHQRNSAGKIPADLASSRAVLLLLMQHAEILQRRKQQQQQQQQQQHYDNDGNSDGGQRANEDDAEVKNLREPSLRFVDYVAVMAFDPDTKQSTVRSPSVKRKADK